MTNEEILKKAITKAIKNGWDVTSWDFCIKDGHCIDTAYLPAIIFSHDFAKAFFGNERIITALYFKLQNGKYQGTADDAWRYHLQLMVLSKDPIKYLEKFL